MITQLRARVLVVDDEVELMRALCDALADEGYEVTGTSDPIAALEGFGPDCFDVLIVDLLMPGIDGLRLMQRALALDSRLATIVMTGEASNETIDAAMKVGAFDYVPKPFKLAVLLPVLERAVQSRRARPIDAG